MKKILIVGLGITGMGLIYFFKAEDVFIYAYDKQMRRTGEFSNLDLTDNVKLIIGQNPAGDEEVDEVYISPAVEMSADFVQKFIERKIPVYGELELFCQGADKKNIVSITGTNGKTTTCMLTGSIYERCFGKEHVSLCGNIGHSIAKALKDTDGKNHYVVEASSFQLEQIKDFAPHIGAILNLEEDHISRHKSFEGYIRAKYRIFENQTADDFLVLNHDDEILRNMDEKLSSQIRYFSMKDKDIDGVYLDQNDGYVYSTLSGKPEKLFSKDIINLIGAHNVQNVLAATLIALLDGIDKKTIEGAVRDFSAPAHRMQEVAVIDQVRYINDSKATNPASTIVAIQSIEKPIILIAGGSDKGTSFDKFVMSFSDKIKALLLFGQTKEIIAKTCDKHDFSDYIILNSLKACVKFASKISKPNDTVLLSPACASHDMYESYIQRGEEFCRLVKLLEN